MTHHNFPVCCSAEISKGRRMPFIPRSLTISSLMCGGLLSSNLCWHVSYHSHEIMWCHPGSLISTCHNGVYEDALSSGFMFLVQLGWQWKNAVLRGNNTKGSELWKNCGGCFNYEHLAAQQFSTLIIIIIIIIVSWAENQHIRMISEGSCKNWTTRLMAALLENEN